eukprot:TRINITY_DN1132_c0_g1_i1.p1 TRINITY_DN1132_c0_g1~~TRINITY_DN1132_c0_g1_i1.p1  ORF type:complete len:171 (+),score=45.20 TRINITY_DN1132_c0_g1_i1:70-582(+)
MSSLLRTALRGVARTSGSVSRLAVSQPAAFRPQTFQQPAFAFRAFADVRFAPTHEWFKADGDQATLGISDFAQGQLGEVVYVELPDVGASFSAKDTICTLESVKAVGEVYAPVDCEIVEVNDKLSDEPAMVNSSPEEEGWLVKVKFSGGAGELMDRDAYAKHLESEAKEE